MLLTSWGSPPLDETLLASLPSLRVVGHAAGSVKGLLPPNAFDHLSAVLSGAPRIADSVGEYRLGAALTLLRRLPQLDARLRTGAWKSSTLRGRELSGASVVLARASSTARAFLRSLGPFGAHVRLYDPYLSEELAPQLGATKSSLRQVVSSDIVSIHLPATAETEATITADLLSPVPDSAIFINSSRATTVYLVAPAR